MRILQSKSGVGKQEIKQDEKLCEPERFVKGMARSLTMLDIIGLVVLTTFQHALFHSMRTGSGNLSEKEDDDA